MNRLGVQKESVFSNFSKERTVGIYDDQKPIPVVAAFVALVLGFLGLVVAYQMVRINVPSKHIAVLTRKTGQDLANEDEVAPDSKHKGLQKDVLAEGRYYRNPWNWDWVIYPMVEIPEDKMGVRIRLYGNELPYGQFVATDDSSKGIVAEVLKPGRYAINAMVVDRRSKEESVPLRSMKKDYVEIIELWDPKVIPGGYKGIVTDLAGPMPEDTNQLLVQAGTRGPQQETLEPGTYYMNPYIYRINAIDTRSQRFNLSEGEEMIFPSKDGFSIAIDGIIEFRVVEETAAKTYVLYNDQSNDNSDASGASAIAEEIKEKVIMPNAHAFCKLRGSNSSARELIGGETRTKFQEEFQAAIKETCRAQGIEIVQALITRIKPAEQIAKPLKEREVAVQQRRQFNQEVLQYQQEAKLATQRALISQKEALIDAQRQVVESVTQARQEQDVAVAEANRDKEVAEKRLQAVKDEAIAILAKAKADAAVVGYENEAVAAGWKNAVSAFGSDGKEYARFSMFEKLAPSYKRIMTNTKDSPLMGIFESSEN